MINCFTLKNSMKMLFLSVVTLIIFCVAGFSSLPAANAQLYGFPPVFSPFAFQPAMAPYLTGAPTYLYNWGVPNYFGPSSSGLLPSATIAGSMSPIAPLRAANARINGVTTVFVPPSATNMTLVVKAVQGVQPTKLSALTAPLTVYIYPSGYVPPTTTTAPAAISGLGGLRQVFPSPSQQPAFPFGQTSVAPPWAVPAPSFIYPFI
jgi:hypothetical protein